MRVSEQTNITLFKNGLTIGMVCGAILGLVFTSMGTFTSEYMRYADIRDRVEALEADPPRIHVPFKPGRHKIGTTPI